MNKPICGKWAELAIEDDYYIPFTANRKAILSFFLCSQEIDLEKLPYNFFQPFHYFKSLKGEKYDTKVEKVYLCDIVGTSYLDYSNDNGIIYSFLHLKRAERYILSGDTKRTKYFYHLKRINDNMIKLSQAPDGKYYVDGNGIRISEHRSSDLSHLSPLRKSPNLSPRSSAPPCDPHFVVMTLFL